MKLDPEGARWELVSGGFRNTFDITFNEDGELFAFDSDMATAVSIVAGIAVLMLGAFTAWTTGIVKSIPPVAHAMLDYPIAALLIAAPFLFGFTDDGAATAFFIVVGVAGLLLTIATRFTPEGTAPRGRRTSAATGS